MPWGLYSPPSSRHRYHLFCEALALCPQGHPNHTLSLFNLIIVLNWRYGKEPTAMRLCRMLLPLCPEGIYFRGIGVDCVFDCVINSLPNDRSDEGIHL
jgi:hypothetical protein